jgi:hypothetical protein
MGESRGRSRTVTPTDHDNKGSWWSRAWRLLSVILLAAGFTQGLLWTVSFASSWPHWGGTPPVNVSGSSEDETWQPVIAASGGMTLVVVWSDEKETGGGRDVFYSRSEDLGHSWHERAVVSTTGFSLLPDVAVVDDRWFVTWLETEEEGGDGLVNERELFSETVREIPSELKSRASRPGLAADEDRLHVVFSAGDPPSSLMYASRYLTETAWPTATEIYSGGEGTVVQYPSAVADPGGQSVHVVFDEKKHSEARAVKYLRYSDGGTVTHTLAQASLEEIGCVHPIVDVDSGGNLYAAYGIEVSVGLDQAEHFVGFTRYDVGTASWTTPITISDQAVGVNEKLPQELPPSIAVRETPEGTVVCVAWHGFRAGGTDLDEEVLLSCSSDGGESWQSMPQNVSRSTGEGSFPDISIYPGIAFDAEGKLNVVWQERVGASGETSYYAVYHSFTAEQLYLPLLIRTG